MVHSHKSKIILILDSSGYRPPICDYATPSNVWAALSGEASGERDVAGVPVHVPRQPPDSPAQHPRLPLEGGSSARQLLGVEARLEHVVPLAEVEARLGYVVPLVEAEARLQAVTPLVEVEEPSVPTKPHL